MLQVDTAPRMFANIRSTRVNSKTFSIMIGRDNLSKKTITITSPQANTGAIRPVASSYRSDRFRVSHFVSPEAKFALLVAQWKRERGATSSITRMIAIPAYQRIIAMGPTAVPLLLRQLRREGDDPDMWFWALELITGENPIAPDDMGDMRAMARAWLRWGDQNGYGWQLVPVRISRY